MKPSVLFNCCTDHQAPLWSDFTHLELGGCITEMESCGCCENTVGGINRDKAEFFTVYGRRHDGECEPITDCDSFGGVQMVAGFLSGISYLEVKVTC
jgi:hypothetical protein